MLEPIKMHMLCQSCQCYPECRNDCPDFASCSVKLGYAKSEKEAMMECIGYLLEQRDDLECKLTQERNKSFWNKFVEIFT